MEIFILFMRKVRKLLLYSRTWKEKLLVLCSFSEEEQLVELPDEFSGRKGITLISNYDKLIDLNNCIEDEKTVLLKAYEARVIYYN